MISHEYPPVGGGGANACMYLASEYIKKGHCVTILTVHYDGLPEYEESDRFRIVRIKSRRKHKEHCGFGEMLDFMFRAIKKSDELVKTGIKNNIPFSICQVFFAIPSGPIGYYLKKKYGLKYVIRFGGGDIPGFQERFKFIYNILGPFERIIWNEAAALVANSEGLKDLAEGFHDKKEILVIPNGVDPEAFAPNGKETEESNKELSEKTEPFRILFVSRLIERKGLQFIIPNLGEIVESVPEGIKLTIVGDGPYREHLEEIAGNYGVKQYLDFVGQKDKSELAKYYNNADLFILPSKKEGMPNVVLEAMSAGLPVIMTPCQGSKELIDGNGFIVNTEEFGKKILQLANDREYAKRLGMRSRELIQERFLWEKTAKKYLELFAEIPDSSL